MQARLTSTRAQGRSTAANARAQAEQAETYRSSGDRYLGEARAALAQDNFENSKNSLNLAKTAYDNSLQLEDDEATWNQRNIVLPNLTEEVNTQLNIWVVTEVPRLLDQVSAAYFEGDFEKAESLVTQAQNTWRLTQSEEHPDIVNWQGMIRVGLRSGRRIPPTAPLYAEMSQLLSEAQRNYEQGRDLMAVSRTEGQRRLDLAKLNIQKVRLVYPMNETAGLLDLRIEQQEDISGFNANFAKRVNDAIAGCKPPRRDMESYNMLLNLRTINPDYPNWPAIVNQAGIDIGIVRPPLDPAIVARSNELLTEARASRDNSRPEEVMDLLRQAITLNPGNREAIALFNELSTVEAGRPVTLTQEAQRMFQQASAALYQNNYLGALSIITAIYAMDARYRSITGLIELEKRARAGVQ
jgi:hypothetical protein